MKFENTQVWGFEHAIRGMRNPMNSWAKSDSSYETIASYLSDAIVRKDVSVVPNYIIGENDMNLCKRLIKGGSEHRKFLRQIFVSVDITAPLYWWKEFDTYKIGTVANSTSTMHKLATTPITMDCFETDDMPKIREKMRGEEFAFFDSLNFSSNNFIEWLEWLRRNYLKNQDKKYWKELVRWLPEGWLQTRTVTMNYENLLTIYKQRKNHKLNEWSGKENADLSNFISWMTSLPYMMEFLEAAES